MYKLGECTTNMLQIKLSLAEHRPLQLALMLRGRPTGFILLDKVTMVPKYSFVDYLSGGLEVGLVCTVDFTRSNLGPSDPKSLHYCGDDDGDDNEYLSAIRAVGDVL